MPLSLTNIALWTVAVAAPIAGGVYAYDATLGAGLAAGAAMSLGSLVVTAWLMRVVIAAVAGDSPPRGLAAVAGILLAGKFVILGLATIALFRWFEISAAGFVAGVCVVLGVATLRAKKSFTTDTAASSRAP